MASTSAKRFPKRVSDDRAALVWGGAGVSVGFIGVVVTSAFYLASPQAAMPHASLDLNLAIEGAIRGATTMHLAGLFGVLGDVTIAAGCLMIAFDQLARKKAEAAFGWLLVGVRAVLVAVVGSLGGFVRSSVAAQAGIGAFVTVKKLFDTLFLLGTATFGAGAGLAFGPAALARSRDVPRALAVPGVVIGFIGAAAGIACLAGADLY